MKISVVVRVEDRHGSIEKAGLTVECNSPEISRLYEVCGSSEQAVKHVATEILAVAAGRFDGDSTGVQRSREVPSGDSTDAIREAIRARKSGKSSEIMAAPKGSILESVQLAAKMAGMEANGELKGVDERAASAVKPKAVESISSVLGKNVMEDIKLAVKVGRESDGPQANPFAPPPPV